MTASVLQAVCTVNGLLPPPPPVGEPTITFNIRRFDIVPNADLVAPVDLWFGPENIVGARGIDGQPISEPAADQNVYDPTQCELEWSWSFGDTGYTPRFTPNLPNSMYDLNIARAKRPCHVFTQPGPKTVTAFVTDSQGGFGFATYTFGPGGNAPAIIDPNGGHFTGREVYFSIDGIFPSNVPTIDRCTTASQVTSRCTTLFNATGLMVRIRTRRGETYTNMTTEFGGALTYMDSYGDPSAANPRFVFTNAIANLNGPFGIANTNPTFQRTPRIIDQDWIGPYDAATETGRRFGAMINASSQNGAHILISRCYISGTSSLSLTSQDWEMWRTLHDCDITNWQDYGVYPLNGNGPRNLAIIGCDIHQKDDALSGVFNDSGGGGNFWDMGNRHGPIRHRNTRHIYAACNSFFNRTGWSISGNSSGLTIQPTTAQLVWRYGTEGANPSVWGYLSHHCWERNSFEGGDGAFGVVNFGSPSITYPCNFIFDGNLIVGTTQSNEFSNGYIQSIGRGFVARNNFFLTPAVQLQRSQSTARPSRAIVLDWQGAAGGGTNRAFIYNNTWFMLATTAQTGPGTRVIADVAANYNAIVASNVLHAPNLTAPQPGPMPLSTSPLAGFTPRYLGDRWNFPPYASDVFMPMNATDRREQPGNPGVLEPGPVEHLEWMFYPYPDYTGYCRGAGRQTTQADFSPTGYHQVSVGMFPLSGSNARPRSVSSVAGGDLRDFVAFDFTPTGIRVQNRFGLPITSGQLRMLFDLPQLRMPMDTSRATPPGDMLWLIPAAGSAGRIATRTTPWPRVDIGGTARAGMRQSASVVTAEGVNFAGALAAVPA